MGVPPGNRTGKLFTNDRTYVVTVPSDSGGEGDDTWFRMAFRFEIDRYTGTGTMTFGERADGALKIAFPPDAPPV